MTADGRQAGAPTSRERILEIVGRLGDLRAVGDVDGIVPFLAPDFVYRVRGDWTLWPFPFGKYDREGFVSALRRLVVEYENEKPTFHELLIDGDQIAFHRTSRFRSRGGGPWMKIDMWDYGRFRDGLVVEFAEYADSGALPSLD